MKHFSYPYLVLFVDNIVIRLLVHFFDFGVNIAAVYGAIFQENQDQKVTKTTATHVRKIPTRDTPMPRGKLITPNKRDRANGKISKAIAHTIRRKEITNLLHYVICVLRVFKSLLKNMKEIFPVKCLHLKIFQYKNPLLSYL